VERRIKRGVGIRTRSLEDPEGRRRRRGADGDPARDALPPPLEVPVVITDVDRERARRSTIRADPSAGGARQARKGKRFLASTSRVESTAESAAATS
jgi:hypothetical protein